MTVKAIIDGDVLIFRASLRAESTFDWGDGLVSVVADATEAEQHILNDVEEICTALGAHTFSFCVSCGTKTFRHDIWPSYKGNRKEKKPILFSLLRDRLVRDGYAICLPKLEGDDVMGIENGVTTTKSVIVTIDKDLRGIPGYHYNPDKPEQGVHHISREGADNWHLIQSIAGDSTDGYGGVPGMGIVKATKLLDKEGYTWETVVKAYEAKGLSEEVALMNARLAKILEWTNWDFENSKVIPWSPNGGK